MFIVPPLADVVLVVAILSALAVFVISISTFNVALVPGVNISADIVL